MMTSGSCKQRSCKLPAFQGAGVGKVHLLFRLIRMLRSDCWAACLLAIEGPVARRPEGSIWFEPIRSILEAPDSQTLL